MVYSYCTALMRFSMDYYSHFQHWTTTHTSNIAHSSTSPFVIPPSTTSSVVNLHIYAGLETYLKR